jgi:hypothetical protein
MLPSTLPHCRDESICSVVCPDRIVTEVLREAIARYERQPRVLRPTAIRSLEMSSNTQRMGGKEHRKE